MRVWVWNYGRGEERRQNNKVFCKRKWDELDEAKLDMIKKLKVDKEPLTPISDLCGLSLQQNGFKRLLLELLLENHFKFSSQMRHTVSRHHQIS